MDIVTSSRERSASEGGLEALVRRIKAEFIEMPGLSLTAWQAGRLLGLDCGLCECLLETLVASGFLRRSPVGLFRRAFRH